jgi:hypothetical protein
MSLPPLEIQQIQKTGITGVVSTYATGGRYGRGKRSHVTLIMREPVVEPIGLEEPDQDSIVYVQYPHEWKKFPPNAGTLKRKIRIEPTFGDPRQSSVMVELATGARQGFGVWWPKIDVEHSNR